MRKNIIILSVAAACLLAATPSCKERKKTEIEIKPEPDIGHYVYLCDSVLHCKKDCYRLTDTEDEQRHRLFGIEFIDTADLLQRLPEDVKYCPRCISDSTYEHLQRIYLMELREDIHTFLLEKTGRDVDMFSQF